MLRKTKIVATLGPACRSVEILHDLIAAGVDVLRVNFSHADKTTVALALQARKIAESLDRPLALMADLQGPKIRIGRFKTGRVTLVEQDTFTLDCGTDVIGNAQTVGVTWPPLYKEVSSDDILLLDDGLISLKVERIDNKKIHCTVIDGGILTDLKGINRQGGGLSGSAMTTKDEADLKQAVQADFDYLCLSFVRDAKDIQKARQLLNKSKSKETHIIAKIERAEAVTHLSQIIQEADGIMVARGDLALEVGTTEVPAIQKKIISLARSMDKIVITATQMMESMIDHPQPTRAEVSDVANAVLDGTDAVMLSAETASGHYPVKTVKMMSRICVSSEKHASFSYHSENDDCCYYQSDQAIAMSAMHMANHFPVQAIIALTESGATAVWMTRVHSKVPVYAISANPKTVARLALVNNVYPILLDFTGFIEQHLAEEVIKVLKDRQILPASGSFLLTRGRSIGVPGGTNSLEIIS